MGNHSLENKFRTLVLFHAKLFTFAGTKPKRPGHEAYAQYFKMADERKVGFIGGGNMAKAIARGFITSEMVKAANIIASATTTKTLAVWKVK